MRDIACHDVLFLAYIEDYSIEDNDSAYLIFWFWYYCVNAEL